MDSQALRTPVGLRLVVFVGLAIWMLIAAFPLFWVGAMSFRLPVDAFATNPLQVLLGPITRQTESGLTLLDLATGLLVLVLVYRAVAAHTSWLAARLAIAGSLAAGWVLAAILVSAASLAVVVLLLPAALHALDSWLHGLPMLGVFAEPVIGFTGQHYRAVWIGHGFYWNFVNSMIVTAGVVIVSLSVGTLAGFALARTKSSLGFWLLITALVFRALPHSVLVAGYLPAFINSADLLAPLWNAPVLGPLLRGLSAAPPTLYGQPWAVIAVLVSINQPFTIWMLRSFFRSIPADLDEAAMVDGCTYFQAFRRVIMPVMWPGVITTGLFSFLLAYNDYLVCAMLLDAQSQTMVPAITQFFNRETTATDQVEAVAAAVSITAPLFLLVMVFQRQIVSGLTAGAVKG